MDENQTSAPSEALVIHLLTILTIIKEKNAVNSK